MKRTLPDMEITPAGGEPSLVPQPPRATRTHSSDERLPLAETDLPIDALLRAFHLLQAQSAHASSVVASGIGIGPTDLRALMFIASEAGVTPKKTGDFLDLSSGAVTSLVDRLVAADLLLRAAHPNDRRSLVLELAPSGVDAVNRVLAFYRTAFVAAVPHEELATVATMFYAIGESLEKAAADDVVGLRGTA